jgi:hypothetical protein
MVESRNERAGPGAQVLAALGLWGFLAGKRDSVGGLKRPERCEEKRPWGIDLGGLSFSGGGGGMSFWGGVGGAQGRIAEATRTSILSNCRLWHRWYFEQLCDANVGLLNDNVLTAEILRLAAGECC